MTPRKKKTKDRHLPRKMIGVEPAIHQQLQVLAKRNNRPLTWEIRRLFLEALEAEGLWPPPPKKPGSGE